MEKTKSPAAERFNADFYRRFYTNPATRVVTRAGMSRRADLIAAFVRHAGLPVRSILDVGCGLGLLRPRLLHHFPRARYVGLEASPYLCERYGWIEASAATYEPRRPFDLVVCYDVLQYLGPADAREALLNFGRLCRGALHFSALTREDWNRHCDRSATDRNVHKRPARWYRQALERDFEAAGCGMFVRRGAPAHLWELERANPSRPARG